MCLTTKAKMQVADKDYLAYKIVFKQNGLRSMVRGFIYELNKVYTLGKGQRFKPSYIGSSTYGVEYERGFHYFTSLNKARDVFEYSTWQTSIVIVECIIPKGAKYVDDMRKRLGVASKIKIIGEVK